MKKVWLVLSTFLFIGCSGPAVEKDISINDEVLVLKEQIHDYEMEVEFLNAVIDCVKGTKNIEINDSIYFLRQEVDSDSISELRKVESETGTAFSRHDFFYEDKDITDFEVSGNNKYIAILSLENSIQQFVLIKHDGEIVFDYDYDTFTSVIGLQEDMDDIKIQIHGYSEDGNVLWGGLGGELDTVLRFVYQVDLGEFIIFDANNRDKWEEYMNLHPVVR